MKNVDKDGLSMDFYDTLHENEHEDDRMTLLCKLQEGKKLFMEGGVKKSGFNNYQKYHYYELKDIVPAVINICDLLRLSTQFNFKKDKATLKVHDVDTGVYIEYDCPLPEVSGGDPKKAMQDIGACQTYARRYLYLAMLDITEADTIDLGQPEKKEKLTDNHRTPKNIKPMKSKIKTNKKQKPAKTGENKEKPTKKVDQSDKNVNMETPYDGLIGEAKNYVGYKLGVKYAEKIQENGNKATTERIKEYAESQLKEQKIQQEEYDNIVYVLSNVKQVKD